VATDYTIFNLRVQSIPRRCDGFTDIGTRKLV
jgi:hypothetical protein